jgi:hypothetical protein
MLMATLTMSYRCFLTAAAVCCEVVSIAFTDAIGAVLTEDIEGRHLQWWRLEGILGPLVQTGATAER